MQLTGLEAINKNLVQNHNAISVRVCSYDLTVDKVIQDGVTYTRTRTIQPQEMFVIVCKEHIRVADGYVAYAFPKTSLCHEGILTLSTGIIDTGYEGLVSTTAINFGKEAFSISPGQPFLRIAFHQLTGEHSTGNAIMVSDDSIYIQNCVEDTKQFPLTFMNIPAYFEEFSKRVKSKVYGDISNKIVIGITVLGFILAGIMGVFTWVQTMKVDTEGNKIQEIVNNAKEIVELRHKIAEQETRINDIAKKISTPK